MKRKDCSFLVCINADFFSQKLFDFLNLSILTLIKVIRNKSIKLLIVDITQLEVEEQIKRQIRDANKELQILLNTTPGRFIKTQINYSLNVHTLNNLKNFKKFLKDTKATVISSDKVNFKEMLTLDFKLQSSYSTKVKAEHCRTGMCLSLKNHAQENNQSIYMISKDQDIIKFCEANTNLFRQSNSLEEFLDIINKENSNYQLIKEYAKSQINDIKYRVTAEIINHPYFLITNYSDVSIDEKLIKNIPFEEINVIYLDKNIAEISINFKVELLINFTYVSDETTFSEDKNNYFNNYKKNSFEIDKHIPIYITLNFVDIQNIKIKKIHIQQLDDVLEYYEYCHINK